MMTWLILVAAATSAAGAEGLRPLRVAVHVDTSVSHRNRTITVAGIRITRTEGEVPQPIEDIARIAHEQGLDAVILADRARAEVSYGLTRFSRLFKVTVSEGSIESYGAERYLERVPAAEGRSEVLIIAGAECIPYYRWRGNVLGGLRLEHLYEHMVIVGLDSPKEIESIPDTAGGFGYRLSWTVLLNLVPIALLVVAWRFRRDKKRPRKLAAVLLILLALLILVDGAPFLPRSISAYEDPAPYPPNVLAAYAESRGALAFWAHPCANPGALPHKLKESSGIDIEVRPYPEVLLQTESYTGFAMFNAGIKAGMPGGEWDLALAEYCDDKRANPVWAISECDYDAHSPPEALAEAQTVVWARERTKRAILDALRSGRCYATLTHIHKTLGDVEWELSDGASAAISGDALTTAAPSVRARVRLRSALSAKSNKRMNVKFVVGGRSTTVALSPSADGTALTAAFEFDVPPAKKLSYVRALVCDNEEPVLALNPIFVGRRPD